jgi:hypothetical protein
MTEYMGGKDAVMPRLRTDYAAGNYELVASIAHYLVFADPADMEARKIEADALEQLGYLEESGAARNAYLTAAAELRGTLPARGRNMISGDIMSAMTTGQLLDYLSVKVNATKADGENYRINLRIPDTGDTALVQVKNSVIVYWLNESSEDATVTVEMPKKTLETLALNPSAAPQGAVVISEILQCLKNSPGCSIRSIPASLLQYRKNREYGYLPVRPAARIFFCPDAGYPVIPKYRGFHYKSWHTVQSRYCAGAAGNVDELMKSTDY